MLVAKLQPPIWYAKWFDTFFSGRFWMHKYIFFPLLNNVSSLAWWLTHLTGFFNLCIIWVPEIINLGICRSPNPDNVLILQTPLGIISTNKLLKNIKRQSGSKPIMMEMPQENITSTSLSSEVPSSVRSSIYQRMETKVDEEQALDTCFVWDSVSIWIL